MGKINLQRAFAVVSTITVLLLSIVKCELIFIEEPQTDQDCYAEQSTGHLTVSFKETNPIIPLDQYKVIWTSGTTTYIDGTTVLIYEGRKDKVQQNARWRLTIIFSNQTVNYDMEVVDIERLDETVPLFASVVEACSGSIIARSTKRANFMVQNSCPSYISPNSATIQHDDLTMTQVNPDSVIFTDQPTTDKTCYVPSSTGALTTSFHIPDPAIPLQKYKVVWKTRQGTTLLDGSTNLIFMNHEHRQELDARWTISMSYMNRTISYKAEVKDMRFLDDHEDLFAHVVELCGESNVAVSKNSAGFLVERTCPTEHTAPVLPTAKPSRTKEPLSTEPPTSPTELSMPYQQLEKVARITTITIAVIIVAGQIACAVLHCLTKEVDQ